MSSSIKVNLEKDCYDIIFDDNFVESAMALIGTSSKCMVITQEVIYKTFEEKFSALKSLPNVEFHFIGQGEKAKSIDTVIEICDKMAMMHCRP